MLKSLTKILQLEEGKISLVEINAIMQELGINNSWWQEIF